VRSISIGIGEALPSAIAGLGEEPLTAAAAIFAATK
jgi:hypothetical protein